MGNKFFCFLSHFQLATIARKQKNTQLCNNFQCFATLQKLQLPGAGKQTEKQCFLWKWGAALPLGKGDVWGVDCPWQDSGSSWAWNSWAGFLCPVGLSRSWQLSVLARHRSLWRDAALKGWNRAIVECEEKSVVNCSNQNFIFQMRLFRPKCSGCGQLLWSQVFHEISATNLILVSKCGESKPYLQHF